MAAQHSTPDADPSVASPALTARGREREATRQRIVAAAREMFAARGYSGTSTRELAAAAGVVERTLYRHFPSKASLFEAAVTEPWRDFVDSYAHRWPEPERQAIAGAEARGQASFDETYDFYAQLLAAMQANRRLVLAMVAAQAFDDPGGDVFPAISRDFAEMRATLETALQSRIGASAHVDIAGGRDVRPITASLMSGLALAVTVLKDWLLSADELDDQERLLAELTTFTLYGLSDPGDRTGIRQTNKTSSPLPRPRRPATLPPDGAEARRHLSDGGPVGPRRVTQVRQVAIPAALLERAGLDVGSEVYFDITDDDPTVIRILPARRLASTR